MQEVDNQFEDDLNKYGQSITDYQLLNAQQLETKLSISNIITPYLLQIAEDGGIESAIRCDKGLKNGVYLYHGILTNKAIGDWFNLPDSDINLIVFPDWLQPEESLCLELEQVIRAIATHSNSSQMTLLVDTKNTNEEEAALILSSVSMNLLMQENLDVADGPEISIVGQLGEMQWEALLPRIQARIVLENENQEAIAQAKAELIPSRNLNSLITSPSPIP